MAAREEHETDQYVEAVKARYLHPLAKIYALGLQDAVIKHINRFGRVLECGCGLGYFMRRMRSEGRTAIGMDISFKVLSTAQDLCGQGIFALADMEALPFRNNSVDIVVVMGVLHHLERPNMAILEVARVLRPGGLFVVEEPNRNLLTFFLRGILSLISRSYRARPRQKDYTMMELKSELIRADFSFEATERYGFLTCFWSMPDTFPLPQIFGSGQLSVGLVRVLARFDSLFRRIPFLNCLCWQNIVCCRATRQKGLDLAKNQATLLVRDR